MSQELNATCAICGNHYHMCLSCKSIMELQPWKIHTDTSEHFKIYQILHGYSTGVYDKAEAKSKLKTVDLSDLDSLKDNIKDLINTIMTNDTTVVETTSDVTMNENSNATRNKKFLK